LTARETDRRDDDQTDNPDRQVDRDFENAVMQAIVE